MATYIKTLLELAICFILAAALIAAPGRAGQSSAAVEAERCLSCHGDRSLSKKAPSGEELSLFVDKAPFEESVHGKISCVKCHSDIVELPHGDELRSPSCAACHKRQSDDFASSIHGKAKKMIPGDLPGCPTCHGKHDVKRASNADSRTFPTNLVNVCTKCHTDERLELEHDLPDVSFVKAYINSVHGTALVKTGLIVSAACNNCHGSHAILPSDDPRSDVSRAKIPGMCGQCHSGILATYRESIHGKASLTGVRDAPVCTDCHGEHTIAKATDPRSKISARNIPKTCSACHEEEKLSSKYGLATKRYVTYIKSFHGLANKFGATFVANCASCHGHHDILPASDPRSSINQVNLPKTCGKCHPGAGENFAKGRIHVEATRESSKGMYYVRQFYTWFIGILMGCFLIYTALELNGRRRRKKNDGKSRPPSGRRTER